MSKLAIAGIALAVLIGVTHGILAAIYDHVIDNDTSPRYPVGYPIP